jgi:hypothetical protein
MCRPASHRAPVEIWSRILAFAISAPLLPSDDDSLISNLYLLQYDCETIASYWESERFRLSCRFVCQSWKRALDAYSHRCFIGNEHESPTRCYRRIQFPSLLTKWAPCHHDYEGPCSPRVPRELVLDKDLLPPDSVRAFVDLANYSQLKISDIVSSFPSLQLLSLQAFEEVRGQRYPISLAFISSELASLTHLALWGFYQTVTGEEQILMLPNLHTLFFHFISHKTIPSRPALFSEWKLPKLRNLGVLGRGNGITTETYKEVHLLIRSLGGTLQGLSLDWLWRHDEEQIPHSLWEWCPHLRFFEVSTFNICAIWPPPATHHGLVIILMDVKEDVHWMATLVASSILGESIKSRKAKIEGHSFSMPISWSSLHKRLDACKHSPLCSQIPSLLHLFTCFQDYGYTFTDRYGVGLDSMEAREFIRWLSARVLTNATSSQV